ncbi:SDR family NAD(P)-dependent oxidoreductase [Aliiglaciecola litoralis]|uniref:SDR family oxidoreductase n=1 Tax=Aliiglaciecola litoralis TaxID=582857 RepID=A0ABN1LE98_9ALTE
MTSQNVLIIGASGGIGAELVKQLSQRQDISEIHGVTRQLFTSKLENVFYHQAQSTQPQQIIEVCDKLKTRGPFGLVICCIGALHGEQNGVELQPEKRLEDISVQQLESYFKTNSIAPMLWLQHLMPLVKSQQKAQIVLLSARVASITDNRLGGWYGYRASKAALNMLIKTAQVEYQRRAKNVELVSYHPGTVDTHLSKPFQANVADDKLFTPQYTVSQLLSHLKTLDIANAPHYIDWDNQTIPW